MGELKIKRVQLRNWMMIKEADVELPSHGLVLVAGSNLAADGYMQSVGAGKTGLGEAICRAVFGVRGRYAHLQQFSTHKKGNAYVRVETELRKQSLVVETGFKCDEFTAAGEALRYQYADKPPVERAKMEQTRNELTQIVGISPSLADWTVFVDGDRLKFNKLSQQDSVNLVMMALAQPPWTAFFEESKKIVNSFKVDHEAALSAKISADGRIKTAKDEVDEASAVVAEVRKDHQKALKSRKELIRQAEEDLHSEQDNLKRIEKRQAEIKTSINKLVASSAESQKALEIKQHKKQDRIHALQEQKEKLIGERSALNERYQKAEDAISEMEDEPENCPTCGKSWDKKHSIQERTKARSACDAAKNAYTTAQNAVRDLTSAIQEIRDEVQELQESVGVGGFDEIKDLRDEYEESERAVHKINHYCRACEASLSALKHPVSDAQLRAAEATLSERKRILDKARADLDAAAEGIVETEETLKVGKYWHHAFSPNGIPNMILNEVIAPLNEVSKSISQRMTGGALEVTYSTSRGLADGRTRAELSISVDNKLGSGDLAGTSKGESGLTNFIIAETLAEVGSVPRRVGFRWYDEIVPHQDPVLCKAIYAYMREIAQRHGMLIFLVDHNPVAENYADHILLVEKTANGSRILWR